MTKKEAIALLRPGHKMPDSPHTSELLDEACSMACKALSKKPAICVVLGVMPEQEFIWRGYQLKVSGKYSTVVKKMTFGWSGLEGSMVCDLINNTEEIMRLMPEKEERK